MSSFMYFMAGGYRHPDAQVNIESFSGRAIFDRRNLRSRFIKRMEISGELQYDTQPQISAAIAELQNAYVDGINYGLYQSDGTQTPHFLDTNAENSLTGNRVVFFGFNQGDAAEYATKRTFRIVIENEFWVPASDLTDFRETLTFQSDGGPMFDVYNVARGAPVLIQRCQRTYQRVIQSGTVTGLLGWPLLYIPAPIFPLYQHRDQKQFSLAGPRRYGNTLIDYTINYAYVFSLPVAQNAFPTAL